MNNEWHIFQPKNAEVIIWGKFEKTCDIPKFTRKLIPLLPILYLVVFLFIIFFFSKNKDEILSEPNEIMKIILILLLTWIVPLLWRKFFPDAANVKQSNAVIPIWMSAQRLIVQTRSTRKEISLSDIKSFQHDFVEGSKSIKLKLESGNVDLLFSNPRSFLTVLNKIRPDLERPS